MNATLESLQQLRHRAGWPVVLALMFPLLAWVWLAARQPVFSVISGAVPRWVLSGSMFSEPFDIGHAGSALDQPTIGKWLFWFTVMAASSLPYAALVGWLANRRSKLGRLMFSAAIAILCFLLLCILSWPLLWLVQYVWSMGPTPRRAVGLFYAIQSGWLVIIFLAWAVRNPGTQSASAVGSSAPGRFRPRVREAKAVASLRSAPALQDGARNLGSIGIQHD